MRVSVKLQLFINFEIEGIPRGLGTLALGTFGTLRILELLFFKALITSSSLHVLKHVIHILSLMWCHDLLKDTQNNIFE